MPSENAVVAHSDATNLPLNQLPEEWQNLDRINVLYSPLRSKKANARDWDSKLQSWKQAIFAYCKHQKLYSFTLTKLEQDFLFNGRSPACLYSVMEELVKQGEFIPLQDFRKKQESTWGAWAVGHLISPLSWTLRKVKSTIVSTNIQNVEYVFLALVQDESNSLYTKVPQDLKNKVVEYHDFLKAVQVQDSDGVKLLLEYLEINGKVSLKYIQQEKSNTVVIILKFYDRVKDKEIRDLDVQICQLKRIEAVLKKQVEDLETKVNSLRDEAKTYLKNGQKKLAKTVLYNKHIIDKKLDMCLNQYQNVVKLLFESETLANSVEVLDVYNASLANLKSQLSALNIDKVEDVVMDLEETLEQNNDMQSTLGKDLAGYDNDDLEAELANLLAEDDNDPKNNVSPKPKPIDPVDDITKDMEDIKLPDVPIDNASPVKPVQV